MWNGSAARENNGKYQDEAPVHSNTFIWNRFLNIVPVLPMYSLLPYTLFCFLLLKCVEVIHWIDCMTCLITCKFKKPWSVGAWRFARVKFKSWSGDKLYSSAKSLMNEKKWMIKVQVDDNNKGDKEKVYRKGREVILWMGPEEIRRMFFPLLSLQ